MKILQVLFYIALLNFSINGAIKHISPVGNNANDGSYSSPYRTFSYSFSHIVGGDTLILRNGTYGVAQGTGLISWENANDGQPPSGTRSNKTLVIADSLGYAIVNGILFIGRSFRKDSNIVIKNLKFTGGNVYNGDRIYVKTCGFSEHRTDADGIFGIGSNEHQMGCNYNVVEDCWVTGSGARFIAMNYRANYTTWRRVVVRGEGCNLAGCAGEVNPNVGFSVYSSHDVHVENMIVLDRRLNGGSPYASFATAQHEDQNGLDTANRRNKWLGCIALNSEDGGFYFENDSYKDSTVWMENCVAWKVQGGIDADRDSNSVYKNLTVGHIMGYNVGLRAINQFQGIFQNCLVDSSDRIGIYTDLTPRGMCVYSCVEEDYYSSGNECASNCYTYNPKTNGLLYFCRIESGSNLATNGYGGGQIGATIVNRYGLDGTGYGDAGRDSLTTTSLWPWPNEALIRSDFKASADYGFTHDDTASTLTGYLWEYLGNETPSFSGSPVKVTWVGGTSTNAALAANYSPAQAPTSIDTILLNTGSVDFVVGSVINVAYVSQVTGYTGTFTVNDTLKANYLGLGTCVANFNAPCVIKDSVVYATASTPTGNTGSKIISVAGSTLRVRLNGNVGTPRVVMTPGSKIKW